LKEKFTKEPVLAVPNLDKKMRMEVDALDYAMGVFYPWNVKIGYGDQWYIYQSC